MLVVLRMIVLWSGDLLRSRTILLECERTWNQTWGLIVGSKVSSMVGSMNNLGTHLFALDGRTKLKARTFVCRRILECNLILIHRVCGDLSATKSGGGNALLHFWKLKMLKICGVSWVARTTNTGRGRAVFGIETSASIISLPFTNHSARVGCRYRQYFIFGKACVRGKEKDNYLDLISIKADLCSTPIYATGDGRS